MPRAALRGGSGWAGHDRGLRKRGQSAVPAIRVLAITKPVNLAGYLLWFVVLAEG